MLKAKRHYAAVWCSEPRCKPKGIRIRPQFKCLYFLPCLRRLTLLTKDTQNPPTQDSPHPFENPTTPVRHKVTTMPATIPPTTTQKKTPTNTTTSLPGDTNTPNITTPHRERPTKSNTSTLWLLPQLEPIPIPKCYLRSHFH